MRVYEKEGKCEWFVRRWGMSARIAKLALLKTHIDPHSDGVIITFSLPPLCR